MQSYREIIMKLTKFLGLLTLIIYSNLVIADLQLPKIFSNNMVLQQNSEVKIWGNDTPNTAISVKASWGEAAVVTSDGKGHWSLTISTPSATTDHQLVISGSSKQTINNINLGEVWLCSGQSNMEMPVKGEKNQPVAVRYAFSNCPEASLFGINGLPASSFKTDNG